MEQKNTPSEISVFVVHPCEIVRYSLVLLLEKFSYKVPLQVDSCESLLDKFANLHADLVLIHYSQYKYGGITKQIIEQTRANVVLLAASDAYHKDSYQNILEQIVEGITGFLDMNEPINTFFSELDDIVSGDMVISKNFVRNITQDIDGIEDKLDDILSNREIEILNKIGTGSTNKEIGEELFISENTVKAHLRNILNKLNLKNRQQAAIYIIKKDLSIKDNPNN